MVENLAVRVLHTAELVGYQAGAVVSRALINQKAGTVTLFAFDAGQELSEHTAPYDALLQVLDGVAEVSIAGQPYRLMTGDSIIMPSHDPHAVKAVTQFKMMLTMVRS